MGRLLQKNPKRETNLSKAKFNDLKLTKLDPTLLVQNFEDGGLSLVNAELMVENCIGKISLPIGLGLNFLINGKHYQIPMSLEEPSVIAAASGAAKFISEQGNGFWTTSTNSIMRGQVTLYDCDFKKAKFILEQSKAMIIQ